MWCCLRRKRSQNFADGPFTMMSDLSDAPYRISTSVQDLNLPTVFVFEHIITKLASKCNLTMEPAASYKRTALTVEVRIPSPSLGQRRFMPPTNA